MKWGIALILLVLVVAGMRFHLLAFDPLTFMLMVVVLWNNNVLMDRQQQTADVIAKSHSFVVSNQKEILRRIDSVITEVKKNNRS
jgi:hypothetical protein